MLVAAGASLTMKDSEGLTPMMQAFAADDHDLAAYLESKAKKTKPYLELVAVVWFCYKTLLSIGNFIIFFQNFFFVGQEKFLQMDYGTSI